MYFTVTHKNGTNVYSQSELNDQFGFSDGYCSHNRQRLKVEVLVFPYLYIAVGMHRVVDIRRLNYFGIQRRLIKIYVYVAQPCTFLFRGKS